MGSIAPLPPLNRDPEPEPDPPFLSRKVSPLQIILISAAAAVFFFFVVVPNIPRASYDPPARRGPDDLDGIGASWDMATQSNRARAAAEELRRCSNLRDAGCQVRVMQLRAVELTAEIDRVRASTDYSIPDKQKMLKQLENERALYLQALTGSASLR